MFAMLCRRPRAPLEWAEVPDPRPEPHQLLIRVLACGVCRTDLHVVDGDLPNAKLPVIPGHEIVGTVIGKGAAVDRFRIGDRVGVPWLGWTCGACAFCTTGRENLCEAARFTGYQIDGGYAEMTRRRRALLFPDLRAATPTPAAAPLLCAGLIGYRTLRMAGDARRVGIYGFGAAAHIVAQVAVSEGREVYAFTRAGDSAAQAFAREMGAVWAGSSD